MKNDLPPHIRKIIEDACKCRERWTCHSCVWLKENQEKDMKTKTATREMMASPTELLKCGEFKVFPVGSYRDSLVKVTLTWEEPVPERTVTISESELAKAWDEYVATETGVQSIVRKSKMSHRFTQLKAALFPEASDV